MQDHDSGYSWIDSVCQSQWSVRIMKKRVARGVVAGKVVSREHVLEAAVASNIHDILAPQNKDMPMLESRDKFPDWRMAHDYLTGRNMNAELVRHLCSFRSLGRAAAIC